MRITLDYRRPTPSHCTIGVFVNGALAGELVLRQDEVVAFQQIVSFGCFATMDSFLSTGNPDPPGTVTCEQPERVGQD